MGAGRVHKAGPPLADSLPGTRTLHSGVTTASEPLIWVLLPHAQTLGHLSLVFLSEMTFILGPEQPGRGPTVPALPARSAQAPRPRAGSEESRWCGRTAGSLVLCKLHLLGPRTCNQSAAPAPRGTAEDGGQQGQNQTNQPKSASI